METIEEFGDFLGILGGLSENLGGICGYEWKPWRNLETF